MNKLTLSVICFGLALGGGARLAAAAPPDSIVVTDQTCTLSQVTAGGSNAGDCIGILSRDPVGTVNDSVALFNSTEVKDISTNPATYFTGFFGYTDWIFGSKRDGATNALTDPLGLNLTADPQALTWSVNGDVLDDYGMFMFVVKQANDMSTYLFTDTSRSSGTWSFDFFDPQGWSHVAIYVRGTGTGEDCSPTDPYYPTCEPPTDVPEPGSLVLLGLGLLGLGYVRKPRRF